MSSVVVLAWDPGETTGWCRIICDANELVDSGVFGSEMDMSWGQIKWDAGRTGTVAERDCVDRMVEMSTAIVDFAKYDLNAAYAVVMEDFLLRRAEMDRSLLAPVRMTAMFEYGMRLAGYEQEPYYLFSAADAKSVFTDERLGELGIDLSSTSGEERHAKDAVRHALLFLRKFASKPDLRRELLSQIKS